MFISRSLPGGKRWSFRFSFFGRQAKGQLVDRDKAARHGVASYRISITSLFRVLSVNWRDYRQKTSRRAFAVANSIFHVFVSVCNKKRLLRGSEEKKKSNSKKSKGMKVQR